MGGNRNAGSHKGQLAKTGQTQDLTSLDCHSPRRLTGADAACVEGTTDHLQAWRGECACVWFTWTAEHMAAPGRARGPKTTPPLATCIA